MRIQRYDSVILKDFRSPFEAVKASAAQELVETPPPPPPPPTFSQAEMDAARKAAYDNGFDDGKKSGVESVVNETHHRDNDAAQAMHKLAGDIGRMQQQYNEVLAKQGSELTELVSLIARKVAGDALDRDAHKMIEGMVTRCLPVVVYKPRVIIDVHPEILDTVQQRLNTLLREAGFTGELTIRAGATIARHDVKIDWAAGYAERSTEALWAEVTSLLKELSLRPHEDSTPTTTESN